MSFLSRLARRQRESHQIDEIEADTERMLDTMEARVDRVSRVVKSAEGADPISRQMRYRPVRSPHYLMPQTAGGHDGKIKS